MTVAKEFLNEFEGKTILKDTLSSGVTVCFIYDKEEVTELDVCGCFERTIKSLEFCIIK